MLELKVFCFVCLFLKLKVSLEEKKIFRIKNQLLSKVTLYACTLAFKF